MNIMGDIELSWFWVTTKYADDKKELYLDVGVWTYLFL